jgi:hypothetical protein
MATARDRKAARTERIIAARAARAEKETESDWERTLGAELAGALLRYLAGKPDEVKMPLKRAMAMAEYSDELKRLIVRCIEANPAMEESFLKIAELAFEDGQEAQRDTWDYPFET